MKSLKFYLIFFLINMIVFVHSALCQNTAFIDVNVVPMDSMVVMNNYDVVIENDIITGMGPTGTIQIPPGALSIAASGKYLMPGLIDMHVHVLSDSSIWPGMWGEEELILFVANGITTIRNMWGDAEILQWRDQIDNNQLFGPTLYTTCPIVDGDPPARRGSIVVTTPDQARAVVIEQTQLGYDFIKIYDNLILNIYDAIIDEANNQNIRVVGHVPPSNYWWYVGLEYALSSGQHSIEHFLEYYSALFSYPEIPIWENIDSTRREEIINSTAQSAAWICPTMTLYKNYVLSLDEYYQFLQRPNVKYVPQAVRDYWHGSIFTDYPQFFTTIRENTFFKKLLKALYDRGANLILGTDCPNPFVVPGFSLYEELQLFVDAGLTPYEAIKCGTYDAAESLDALDVIGTVAIGKRADFILINDNPFDDINHIQDRVGVMARGNWYTEAQLQYKLDILAQKYSLFVENVSVNKVYQKPGIDTLQINAKIANPYNLAMDVKSFIVEKNLSLVDSINLYDDGTHGDSIAGDGTYSGLWPVDTLESMFNIYVSTQNLDSGYYYISQNTSFFTTIGPVVFENYRITSSDTIPHHVDRLKFEFTLRNDGLTATATNITSQVVSLDTFSIIYPATTLQFGNIQAGGSIVSTNKQYIEFDIDPFDTITVKFRIDIFSNEVLFWSDTFSVVNVINGLEQTNNFYPQKFDLSQNYPNPFNPITKIEFSIPKTEFVSLKIYNLLGQEVATLVSNKLTPGSYNYFWDAGSLASGVYIYKIEAGEFIRTRKLILMK